MGFQPEVSLGVPPTVNRFVTITLSYQLEKQKNPFLLWSCQNEILHTTPVSCCEAYGERNTFFR